MIVYCCDFYRKSVANLFLDPWMWSPSIIISCMQLVGASATNHSPATFSLPSPKLMGDNAFHTENNTKLLIGVKIRWNLYLVPFLYEMTLRKSTPSHRAITIYSVAVIADICVVTKDIYSCDNDYHCHLRNINFQSLLLPFPYHFWVCMYSTIIDIVCILSGYNAGAHSFIRKGSQFNKSLDDY